MRDAGSMASALVVLLLASTGVCSQEASALAQQTVGSDRVGVAYEITRLTETHDKDNKGSTGQATDRDTLVERVLAVRDDGFELEYDVPADTKPEIRATEWTFPVRIFRPYAGPSQVLDTAELEERVQGWLKRAGMTRDACGKWVFTWNAFKIECDPQSAIENVEAFYLRFGDVRDGGTYKEPQESGPMTLRKTSGNADGATFTGHAAIDPERVRREQAQADVVVAEITKRRLTLEQAVRARSEEKVSGHIDVTVDTKPDGSVWRRTRTATVQTTAANGVVDEKTITDTLTRRIISGEPRP